MKLYATLAQIDHAILQFSKNGVSLQREAHRIACSVLAHVGEHGDIRVVSKFLAGMPEMARVNAVRAWFEAHGPITFKGNEPVYVKGGKTKLGEAMETPFHKFRAEPEYEPINPSKALDKLIKRLALDAKKTGRNHSATIQALRLVPVGEPIVTVAAPLALTFQPAVH